MRSLFKTAKDVTQTHVMHATIDVLDFHLKFLQTLQSSLRSLELAKFAWHYTCFVIRMRRGRLQEVRANTSRNEYDNKQNCTRLGY
jgi:hypothetical protein